MKPGLRTSRRPDAPLATDARGCVADDLLCIKCHYNLRGSIAAGRCPECGLSVERSAKSHWLRYCEPDWVQCICSGLNRLACLIVCALVFVTLAFSGLFNHNSVLPEGLVVAMIASLIGIGVVMGLYGFWLATAPDPAALDESLVSWRRLSRTALIASIVIAAFGVHLMMIRRKHELAVFLSFVSLAGSAISLLMYARSLARRIPAFVLARITWQLACLSVIFFNILICHLGLMWLSVRYYWFQQSMTGPVAVVWSWLEPNCGLVGRLLLAY